MTTAGSRRQAVRRRLDSFSSRLLHMTILDFRLRLLLLAALTLPFILLGGCVHALASGHPWTTSVYLVYGLLFRVPALGAVRQDEPAASALVLNAVFLFGTFGFAILLGLIGEEVKGTVKALRAGGTPLDLYEHVVLLNFTSDATAVALLRQMAEDVAKPGSPLYGRPIVVLASPPPAAAGPALVAAAGCAQQSSVGGGGGDVEGVMKHVVADALQGCGSCEWHLRVGSSCRTDDLARVCAATASYIVLLADPRVATSADATAAGAASSLQAQSLMCLSLALSQPVAPLSAGGGGCAWRGSRGRTATGGGGGSITAWGATSHPRQQVTIVVQSPADVAQPLPPSGVPPGYPSQSRGPIATFRAVATAEGSRPQVIEVCDRGIVDRLVAQTVLQPGVATVLARLFGGSAGQGGGGFRWVEWPGFPSVTPTDATASTTTAATKGGASHRAVAGKGSDGFRVGNTGGLALMRTGLRQRRLFALPRTLSYSASPRSLGAAEVATTASSTARGTTVTAAGGGGAHGADIDHDASTSPATEPAVRTDIPSVARQRSSSCWERCTFNLSRCTSTDPSASRTSLLSFASAAFTALYSSMTADSALAAELEAIAPPDTSAMRPGGGATTPLASTPYHPKAAPLQARPGICSSSSATFGEVRAALADFTTAEAATERETRSSSWCRQQPNSPSSFNATSFGGSGYPQLLSSSTSLRGLQGSMPVLVGYMSGATGTLRLNPRDASPVYPGDKLVLLVSEQAEAERGIPRMGSCLWGKDGSRSLSRHCSNRSSCDINRSGGGGGGRGWMFWGRSCGAKAAIAQKEIMMTGDSSASSASNAARTSECNVSGGSKLLFSSSDTKAVAAAMFRNTAGPAAPPPLQAWYSGPPEQDVGCPDLDDTVAPELNDSVTDVRPSAADSAAAYDDCRGDTNGTAEATPWRASSAGPGRVRPTACTPTAPPSYIIVISRTATAVREVVAGLQEFAPAGSTIVLVTHEPGLGVRQLSADIPTFTRVTAKPAPSAATAISASASAVDASSGGGGSSTPAPTLDTDACMASVLTKADTTGAVNNSRTTVRYCPSSSWPVGEADLVIAGLASATAVLVGRDSGLQPHEADAIALSVVLQLHQTLTDPTRSPLRRCPPSPQHPSNSNGAHATTPTVFASTSAAAALSSAAGVPQGMENPFARQLVCAVAQGSAEPAGNRAAAAAAAATFAAAESSPAPLHVVVCLHNTRARDTLKSFLKGLNMQQAHFTLEALVPEEYRALLLAGVVRHPQSHAIMTDLLSDRPGAPEVYIVPPARLMVAAASLGLNNDTTSSGGMCPYDNLAVGSRTFQQLNPGAQTGDQVRRSTPHVAQKQAGARQQPPQAAHLWTAGLSGWCFRDVAQAARACGCTAIGVLRGSTVMDGLPGTNSIGGKGRFLQLAPCPDVPLELATEDRLVVLAAGPV